MNTHGLSSGTRREQGREKKLVWCLWRERGKDLLGFEEDYIQKRKDSSIKPDVLFKDRKMKLRMRQGGIPEIKLAKRLGDDLCQKKLLETTDCMNTG